MTRTISKFLAIFLLGATITACSSPEEKAAEYVENANALLDEGKLQKAEIEYKNALQINQNLPDAWFGLAKLHERKQEWRKAYAVLNKIRELAPNHLEGRIMLSQILLASNQLDQALSDTQEILQMAPENPRALALMAAVQFRLGNNDGAREQVDRVLAADPDNNEALLVRARLLIAEESLDKAHEVLDRAIATNPDNVSFYLMKLQAHQLARDLTGVEQVYKSLIERFPDNAAFKNALARLYLGQDDVDRAEKIFEGIVADQPDSVDERIRLVEFKNYYRSTAQALELLQSYIRENGSEYRYRFLLGDLHAREGETDKALQTYQSIADEDGLNANGLEARNKIALLQLRAGEIEKSRALVNEILSHDKANEDALLMQAGFQIADRQFDDAIVNARTVLRDNPDSIRALALLGQAYEAKGSPELAEEAYTNGFQINPGMAAITNQLARLLLRKRDATKADEVLSQSLAAGNRSLDSLKIMAQVKMALGDWEATEKIAKELEDYQGQEAVSQQILGVVYLSKEQQENSIGAFKKAHELAPDAAEPIVALVRTYMRDNKIAEARGFLDSVLAVDEDNITAHLLLGRINLFEDKVPEAISRFEKVVEISPGLDTGYRSLASVYTAQGKLDKAEQIITQGLEAIPDLPSLSLILASLHERKGEFNRAISVYESMLQKNPDQIVAKNNLASLLTDYGDGEASIQRAREISAELKDSPIPQFRDTYAWASVKSGINLEEAVVILEKVVEENQDIAIYNYHLGEAYRKKGDTDNAIAYLKRAASQSPTGSDIAKKAEQSLQQLN